MSVMTTSTAQQIQSSDPNYGLTLLALILAPILIITVTIILDNRRIRRKEYKRRSVLAIIIIWLFCPSIFNVFALISKEAGVLLGALPTVFGFGLSFFIARCLCVVPDSILDENDAPEDDKPKKGETKNMFFINRIYKKNSTRLINICEELIEKYQTNDCKPSCKSDLLELIKSRILNAKTEITEWKDSDTDYIKIAHIMLAHATFDLLASGRYHLYRGMLNPMSCADNLMDVYKACMEYGIKTNLLDEETRKEQYEYLLQSISGIG